MLGEIFMNLVELWCVEVHFENPSYVAGRRVGRGYYFFIYDNYEHANHVVNKAKELNNDGVRIWRL